MQLLTLGLYTLMSYSNHIISGQMFPTISKKPAPNPKMQDLSFNLRHHNCLCLYMRSLQYRLKLNVQNGRFFPYSIGSLYIIGPFGFPFVSLLIQFIPGQNKIHQFSNDQFQFQFKLKLINQCENPKTKLQIKDINQLNINKTMSNVQYLNPKAEVLKKIQALAMNINAAMGLQDVMKSNLGPKGTLKMLVGGAGQIKLTKDGNVLLHEMQIQHPTAGMIARSATAQDDIVGDGTTSNVLLIGELMKQAQRLIQQQVHPRVITEGYELARKEALKFLDQFRVQKQTVQKPLLISVARTSLCSKLHPDLANQLVDIVVDAVNIIKIPDKPIDLHMVEIMHMVHKLASDTKLVKGLVLDHGARNPNMPKRLANCYILTCNVNLEYEKTEVNSQFFFSNAADREKMAKSERKFTDERCKKIIELKKKVCEGNDKSFVVINEKGIDPVCLEAFANENIIALRRAKRRNMERIVLACGGTAVNSVEELTESDLGYADQVYEVTLGEQKYTFIEGVKNPRSCTVLIKGPNEHTIAMIKDAVRDGLRAVKNVYDDKAVVPGAGSFQIACNQHLLEYGKSVQGKAKLGIQSFAESLLVIPKTLAQNSGYDIQQAIIMLQDEYHKTKVAVGLNLQTVGTMSPMKQQIYDNYCCKKQWLNTAPTLAQQLLLVDEIMRAGKGMGGGSKMEQ